MSSVTAAVLATLLTVDGGTPPAQPTPDGGAPAPFSSPIYSGCPVTEEQAVPSDGVDGGAGWWLPEARARRTACLLATCEEYRAQVDGREAGAAARQLDPGAVAIISIVMVGVAGLAFGAGYVVGRLNK